MHSDKVTKTEDTCTQTHIHNSIGLEKTLCSVIVDGFLMKSGAVCLPYATHGFQPQRHGVGENKTKTEREKITRSWERF